MTAAWMIRAGGDPQREKQALADNLAILGWPEIGDLSGIETREGLRTELRRAYPDEGERVLANWTGQLWRAVREIKNGDIVVMPLRATSAGIAIGRVTGPYLYRSDGAEGFHHARPVKWLVSNIPRSALKSDLLHSLGSLLTVCALARYDAPRRLEKVIKTGVDPGRPGEGDDQASLLTLDAFLNHAAEMATRSPVRLTTRELIERWDYTRRTVQSAENISADLAEKGLTTRPPFTEDSLDAEIEIVPARIEPSANESGSSSEEQKKNALRIDSLQVGQLEAANRGVCSVAVGATVERAITLMLKDNYSQLAVLDEDENLHGAVSWESVCKALLRDNHASLSDATISARVVEHDEYLLSQIDEIDERGYVFVRSPDRRRISGIVTSSDLTQKFGNMTRPFALLEEIELRLRRRVDRCLGAEEIRVVVRQPWRGESADNLTLGSYKHLLKEEPTFRKLGWRLDHEVFLGQLEQIIKIRNEVMHFSPDPVKPQQLESVLAFANMIRAVDE
ncbi:CBS domain-containing protein [Plantactinospora siamensis]|uniref:CBS domain-containing protein n=1 Tax=Plantactinospora siamensis TaxID=555372 RepID=A0ABV6P1M2_9ACTN